jgi:anti-anti-sigma factor
LVLIPAAMGVLGERNWYLPSWLGWLPRVNVEGAEPAVAAATAGGGGESWRLTPGSAAAPEAAPVAGEASAPPVAPLAAEGLGVQVHRDDRRATFVLTGELDLVATETFRQALAPIEAEGVPLIVVDLRELRFMDSTGLAEFVRATRDARAQQRRLVLVTGSEPIDRILAVSGVGQTLVDTISDPAALDE